MPRGPGEIQQKVLLLLLAGLTLGLSRSPRQYFKIVKAAKRDWDIINQQSLRRSIKGLYESKLICQKENGDGSCTLFLTKDGRKKALTFKLDEMKIKKVANWDKKWRVVIFDIPEKNKKIREAFRFRLKTMGFCELQKSVFISPYECREEIEYLVEFYRTRRFVRFMVLESIDNEIDLRHRFSI